MIDHLAVQLRHTIVEHRGRPATRIRTDTGWRVHSFEQFGRRIDEVAQGLLDRGIAPGDRIGLFAANCPEWSEIDFGATTVRAVPVPFYATSTPQQIRHIATDSGLRIMFVGGRSECERVLEVASDLPELELIVVMTAWQGMPSKVISLDDFRTTPNSEAIGRRLASADPDDLALIIYTSGTTVALTFGEECLNIAGGSSPTPRIVWATATWCVKPSGSGSPATTNSPPPATPPG